MQSNQISASYRGGGEGVQGREEMKRRSIKEESE